MNISLTIDDAPMMLPGVARIPDAVPDPEAMDGIRAGLQRVGVRSCVAFVVGATAERLLEPLERWLEAGYELGNHTYDHVPASDSDHVPFIASVERCDALLSRIGAFRQSRRKWFRFPQLDYGMDEAARRRLREALLKMGYSIAHGSTDLYDYAYEGPFGLALRGDNALLRRRIMHRFRRCARFSLWQSRRLISRHYGADAPLVAYAHFSRVSGEGLVPLLEELLLQGAVFCPLEQAQRHAFYMRLDWQPDRTTGLVTSDLPRGLAWRGLRRLVGLARPIEGLWTRRLGPSIPALVHG
jgi:peptidoglycan/xylan/chitin deacetylase (PgdA/CDA1 family)